LIDFQLKRLRRDKSLLAQLRHGEFGHVDDQGSAKLEFMVGKNKYPPIQHYPHTKEDVLEGAVTMLERPYYNQDGSVPAGMYDLVFDPFYNEDAEDTTSLFAMYVIKQPNRYDNSSYHLPVAWFVGRPKDINRCYRILFDFCEYYNCKAQGEIAGGGKGVLDYAKVNKLLHRVHFEPEIINGKKENEASREKNKSYLMNMPTTVKGMGLTYLVNWHTEQRGVDEKNRPILNIHRIYDIPFLQELRKFDGKKNADRLSAMLVGMFQMKENVLTTEKETEKKKVDDFYTREFYSDDVYEEDTTISLYQ